MGGFARRASRIPDLCRPCFFVVNLVLLARWFIFIKALEVTSSARDVVRYYFIGLFGNLFLPSTIGGDILKIYGLCRNSSQKTRVVASVLLDRLSGFAAIVVVSVVAFILGYRFLQEGVIVAPIIGMAVLAGGLPASCSTKSSIVSVAVFLPNYQRSKRP